VQLWPNITQQKILCRVIKLTRFHKTRRQFSSVFFSLTEVCLLLVNKRLTVWLSRTKLLPRSAWYSLVTNSNLDAVWESPNSSEFYGNRKKEMIVNSGNPMWCRFDVWIRPDACCITLHGVVCDNIDCILTSQKSRNVLDSDEPRLEIEFFIAYRIVSIGCSLWYL